MPSKEPMQKVSAKKSQITENFVETISAIQFSNGVVRLFFVGQELSSVSLGVDAENDPVPELRECVTMPLPGFLHSVSVIQNFLSDDKMEDLLKRFREADILQQEQEISS